MNYQPGKVFVAMIAAVCLASPQFAVAELPSIRFDRIQPLGLGAGTSLEVEAQGRDTEDVQALRFEHAGLSAELVKPGRFKVTAQPNVPAGTYDVRMVGKYGVSNPRILSITHGLTDVAETEPNNEAAQAQGVALNSAINGTSDGNGQDVFKFNLKKGQRVVIDCQAMKLESQLDANLILNSATGQSLASSGDYHGRDPFIDFAAPSDGEYFAVVHDLIYRGGLPYRLVITTLPHVENLFPRAVQAGQTVNMTAYGRSLKEGAGATLPPQLDEFTFPLSVPSDLARARQFSFFEHPIDHTVAPTAATFALNGMQVRAPVGAGALHPACVMVTDLPVILDIEPNDERTQPQKLTLPAIVSGRFDKPRDADWFEVDIPENGGGEYSFEVYSERISGQSDPYVSVYDDKDMTLGELDDSGPRTNAFDAHIRDPIGVFNLQAKRKYHIVVQDRYSRGGPRYQYVLAVRKPVPDFDIAAIHAENPGPSGNTVWAGGSVFMDVIAYRHQGFTGAITVTAEGLPPGVYAAPTSLFNNDRTTFVFWADENAPVGAAAVKLIATAAVEGQTLRHEVRPYTRVWADANPGSSAPMRDLIVGVREKAPYVLKVQPEKVTVEAGKEVSVKVIATRYWPDFKDKITVIPLAFPGVIQMPTAEIPGGANETTVKFTVQNGARAGDYTISVLGQAQVPFNKDPQAKDRPNTLVSSPSLPLTITVTEPPKK
ncbi:MAG: hypothetical protein JWN70_6100 [Planctomycetaceae bacterium]|nr:hypothetical protein [Planctomycetaceae bacterium]